MNGSRATTGKRGWRVLAGLCLLAMMAVAHADKVTYVYTDPQGTPLAEADAQGNIIARYDYTPYGVAVPSLGNPPDGPGYTGHVNDPETDLVYMQARYYDPSSGQFLSVDPVGPAAGNLFSFNRYAYADNNPIVHDDPTGMFPGDEDDFEYSAYPVQVTFFGSGDNGGGESNNQTTPEQQEQNLTDAQDAAINNPAFQPSGAVTHCNQATCAVANATGAPMAPLTDARGVPLLANQIRTNLAKPGSGYKEITATEAQQLANRGVLVIVTGPGHVATVRADTGQNVPGRGPIIANIGRTNGVLRLNYVFPRSSIPKVKFYTPDK